MSEWLLLREKKGKKETNIIISQILTGDRE